MKEKALFFFNGGSHSKELKWVLILPEAKRILFPEAQ